MVSDLSKTTPRPWHSAEYASPRGTAFIRGPNHEKIIGGGLSPSVDDAALIVRAVNSFDEMREVLEVIVHDTHNERSWIARYANALAVAALAKANSDE